MSSALRIGFLGLDTSHVVEFAKIFNSESDPHHIPGFRVTCAYPGGSKDFELSWSRVGKFTDELKTQRGITMLDSPEAVAEGSDVVFIESVDGRVHLDQFKRTAPFRKPTFIDKPLALSVADAKQIFTIADQHGVTVMSASALRYSDGITKAIQAAGGKPAVGCDVFGPMSEQPTQPGLFWYGIHHVETIVALMGPGCRRVRVEKNNDFDVLTGLWSDGRIATMRGARRAHFKWGATIHWDDRFESVDLVAGQPFYVGLLKAIVGSLPKGESPIPREQTLDVIRIIEAANRSRETGEVVELR